MNVVNGQSKIMYIINVPNGDNERNYSDKGGKIVMFVETFSVAWNMRVFHNT